MKTMLAVIAVIVLAVNLTPVVTPAQQATEEKPIAVKAQTLITPPSGDIYRENRIPFNLTSVPEDAVIHLSFKVLRSGTCPLTYKPTVVWMNGRDLRTIDFRSLKTWDQDFDLPIPNGVLKVGKNMLTIALGACRKDIDVVRLGDIAIR